MSDRALAGNGRPHRLAAPSKDRLRLWLRLLRRSRHIESELRERLRREFDITLPRFDVLAALHRAAGDMTMTELSRALMVSNGNVTGIVDRLVAEKLVVRAPKEGDRRTTCVRLTPHGVASFEKMARVHEAWVDELLGDISPAQARQLLDGLAQIQAKSE